ncbi:MAG: signal peptidase II [Clostridiales bacterium]|nr:signal peptidase II [Clostridiales bacterium]
MKQRIRHLIYVILLVAIDQVTKSWASTRLKGTDGISIIPGVLKFQYHENTGAVWGILSGKTDFLTILTIILIVLLIFIYFKIPNSKRYLPIQITWVFILAGAIGNFIDRASLKYVVDFIYIELIDFPIFNIADNYMTFSCVILLILGIFYYKEDDFVFLDNIIKKAKKENDNDKSN